MSAASEMLVPLRETAVFFMQKKATSDPATDDYLTEARLLKECALRLKASRIRGWRRGYFMCLRSAELYLGVARARTFVPRSKDWGRRI